MPPSLLADLESVPRLITKLQSISRGTNKRTSNLVVVMVDNGAMGMGIQISVALAIGSLSW